MPNILVVEDNIELAQCVVMVLSKHHQVTHAPNLATAKSFLSELQFNLVLLDVDLPDGSGFDMYQWMKSELKWERPVMFLTGESDLTNRLKGLELGAKDYILKPFYSKELVLRIELQLKQFEPKTNVILFADLKIEKSQLRVSLIDQKIEKPLNLTPNEFKILMMLVENTDENVSRDEIINNVWGVGFNLSAKAVNTHICNLRKKMQSKQVKIISYEGKGYCLRTA